MTQLALLPGHQLIFITYLKNELSQAFKTAGLYRGDRGRNAHDGDEAATVDTGVRTAIRPSR
jgi:hypothetical protein